jgi:hypothetical protein
MERKDIEGRRAGGMMEVESKEDMWLTVLTNEFNVRVIRFKHPRIIRGQCKILECGAKFYILRRLPD